MLKLIGLIAGVVIPILCTIGHAGIRPLPAEENLAAEASQSLSEQNFSDQVKEILGITYFSYFFGSGLHPENFEFFPNQLGYPDNDGIYFQNQLSVRLKFSRNLALDFQSRFKILLNNYTNNPKFEFFRWETPRIGISGKLLSGNDWDLTGAVNTDFPYFFPAPFSGFQALHRKTLITPGMFASLKIAPKGSKWSMFSVVSPRYFFYSDRDVAEPQYLSAGYIPQNKPELILSFQPTINYSLDPSTKITLGTTLDYRKLVISDWNLFDASLVSNGKSKAWRLNAVPLILGITYTLGPALTVFPYIATYPIAAQRKDDTTGKQASLLHSTAFGMWISGTLF